MSASNSPIDPLYWFKNEPKNVLMLAYDLDDNLFHIDHTDKWRIVSRNEEHDDFTCEIVGSRQCGTRFYLTEEAFVQAEQAD